ncbi:MAG: hypothetical protein V5A18_01660 [Haloarculaceae archaeon]
MNHPDWTPLLPVVVGAPQLGPDRRRQLRRQRRELAVVDILLGASPDIEAAVYLRIGLAALWSLYLATRLAGVRIEEMAPGAETPERPAE